MKIERRHWEEAERHVWASAYANEADYFDALEAYAAEQAAWKTRAR